MDLGLFIEYLKQKHCLTDLEKDILDTWNELQKIPFDRSSAQAQIRQNNLKYPEILTSIAALPATVVRSFNQATESDIQYNLEKQFVALVAKEGWSINGH